MKNVIIVFSLIVGIGAYAMERKCYVQPSVDEKPCKKFTILKAFQVRPNIVASPKQSSANRDDDEGILSKPRSASFPQRSPCLTYRNDPEIVVLNKENRVTTRYFMPT